jgi:Holliday junction resolvase RusA-like endonuclease
LQRPRLGKSGVYSKQSGKQQLERFWFLNEMRQKGYSKLPDSPIGAIFTFHHEIPRSWSQKKRKAAVGASYISTPDIDNCIKYYFDVLNDVAYSDDRFISFTHVKRVYAEKPGVEIELFSIGGQMSRKHVRTISWELSLLDLNSIALEANRLGAYGSTLRKVVEEQDENGRHYFFEINAPKTPDVKPIC